MRIRRTTSTSDLAPPARELFESSALYDLVSRLAVASYEDLLACHWTVPDRASPAECLDADRFTRRRSRSIARAVLALHADRSVGTRRDMRLRPLIARADEARAVHGHPLAGDRTAVEPAQSPIDALRRRLAACVAWLRRVTRARS